MSGGDEQARNGYRRRARAVYDDTSALFADDLERVRKPGKHDDGGAVLVVMENGDVALLLELALYLKAARGGDILKIYAAKGAGDVVNRLDKFISILGLYT